MTVSIELISPSLLNNRSLLRETDRWLSVMARPNGWHYDLDHAWILEKLEEAGICPGQTILDAGAGLGVRQYILASRGYNVISLDFKLRSPPPQARGIFKMTVKDTPNFDYKHDYMNHISHQKNAKNKPSIREIVRKAAKLRDWGYYAVRAAENLRNNIANRREKGGDHTKFGTIQFLRASFHEIPLSDAVCDAAISVSAIEHADKNILPTVIEELKRIVKLDGPVAVTTSATIDRQDVFHELTQGWCFSAGTLSRLFNEQADFVHFKEFENALLCSKTLWSRMHASYRRKGGRGLFPSRPTEGLPYLPVGIFFHGRQRV